MLRMQDFDLRNKRVLLREDLNVSLNKGKITSTKRIEAILPTLKMCIDQGAKVILMSHLGRPKEGSADSSLSLAPVASCLQEILHQKVPLIQNFDVPPHVEAGNVVLLENVRFLVGEKENEPDLSQRFANLCDIFVMDAFATAHRKEASTYGVAEYAPIACAGPLLLSEIEALTQIIATPKRPLIAIVGGAKVSSKLLVLQNLLPKIDGLIVGGGIANTFLVAAGHKVGRSLYEEGLLLETKEMLSYAKQNAKCIIIPEDVVVADSFSETTRGVAKLLPDVQDDEWILDVGPKTIDKILPVIANANTIVWNGPLGVFEWEQFSGGTMALAKAIAQSNAYSVAGGGDTLAAIDQFKVEEEISYISTGGGAFLEYLEGKTLPAIEILEKRKYSFSGK